ncbi:MAG: TVP38/TMEM64 family protein [Bacteroidota bacterium]
MDKHSKSSSVKQSKAPLIISVIIIIGLILAYFFIPNVQHFLNEAWNVLSSNDEDRIKIWVDQFGWMGPLVIILAMTLQMFLLVLPSLALMVVSILAYGPVWGSLIVLVAIFTASTVGYAIGRFLGTVIVKKLIGNKTEKKIGDFLEDYGFWAVIITRLNPILSNDAISFVAGVLKMSYWRFIGATMVGISPLILFIAVLGETTDSLKTGLLWGSVISLILFLGYIWWDKSRKK